MNVGATEQVTMPMVSVLRDRLLMNMVKGRGDLDLTVLQQSVREDAGRSATRS